jgi:hypothetical protein
MTTGCRVLPRSGDADSDREHRNERVLDFVYSWPDHNTNIQQMFDVFCWMLCLRRHLALEPRALQFPAPSLENPDEQNDYQYDQEHATTDIHSSCTSFPLNRAGIAPAAWFHGERSILLAAQDPHASE